MFAPGSSEDSNIVVHKLLTDRDAQPYVFVGDIVALGIAQHADFDLMTQPYAETRHSAAVAKAMVLSVV